MTKNTYKSNTFKKKPRQKEKKKGSPKNYFFKDKRFLLVSGLFLLILSLYLLTAFISYLFTGKADQSVVEDLGNTGWLQSGAEVDNWLGIYGALVAHYFIFRWFGLAAFFTPPLLFITGYRVVFKRELLPLVPSFVFSSFFTVWVSLLLGYFVFRSPDTSQWAFLSGGLGTHLSMLLDSLIGWGTFMLLIFSLLVFIIYFFNVTSLLGFNKKVRDGIKDIEVKLSESQRKQAGEPSSTEDTPQEGDSPVSDEDVPKEEELIEEEELSEIENSTRSIEGKAQDAWDIKPQKPNKSSKNKDFELDIEVSEGLDITEQPPEKPAFSVHEESKEEVTVDKQENYDPTLDLGSYQYPTTALLNEYEEGRVQVTKGELEQNKDKIVETLINFKIGISSIKATIGPTVTLYEIVPEAGVKISKIKNLEDDIALSLAALGIRIIAPIPGKGTIGIEVPNKKREMVSARSVFTTDKFMQSDKELPVALGRTISNEVHVIDLAKMPHILMAGATGQGKSVGLNVLLTSLLYKKHPSQLKLVLVDPKKVELTLFNKIERHFLAKLPNSEEAIITDTKKVVNTLNSLCIEMDTRYDLLKNAGARNLKEYNGKFVTRRLNPEKGHRFLPYIVLVIDELADLMMTAGKEVETPIARLAQLARAIGIHLVVATQRPSVNVITGVIKANFPARLSFRVTSKIDSRTILDTGGADQLVGMGDMLFSQGSDIIRLQCAFVDTPEVEKICDFIGEQRGYDDAYLLPEFVGDDEGGKADVDLSDRDALFDEAARLIVTHQQGSTSLIQRKLKLGYNRAGRLIDQLEAAGVVGPFEGSKAREVLVPDEYSLEQLLNDMK